MATRMLIAVDGSPLSFRALRYALREFPEAEFVAYHVVDLFEPDVLEGASDSSYEPMIGSDAWDERVSETTDTLFEEVAEIADEYDRSVATDSDIGDPKRLVVDYAVEEDVDAIVVGAHGRPGRDRPLFGSVADTVVRRATIPVIVVR